jgi:hypothetical protein
MLRERHASIFKTQRLARWRVSRGVKGIECGANDGVWGFVRLERAFERALACG